MISVFFGRSYTKVRTWRFGRAPDCLASHAWVKVRVRVRRRVRGSSEQGRQDRQVRVKDYRRVAPLNNSHRKPNLELGLKGKHSSNLEGVLKFSDGRKVIKITQKGLKVC